MRLRFERCFSQHQVTYVIMSCIFTEKIWTRAKTTVLVDLGDKTTELADLGENICYRYDKIIIYVAQR